jgi:hypothetical protein
MRAIAVVATINILFICCSFLEVSVEVPRLGHDIPLE